MFLKTSLEDKLKRSLSEYNPQPPLKRFKYSPNKNSSFKLFNAQTDKKVNFPRDHKKFNDDDIPEKAKAAKEFAKALIDPDILEVRKKRWNISSQSEFNERPELKKTLFEVSHGLKDFKVVPLKDKKEVKGTDTRDKAVPLKDEKGTDAPDEDVKAWTCSTQLELLEKKMINSEK